MTADRSYDSGYQQALMGEPYSNPFTEGSKQASSYQLGYIHGSVEVQNQRKVDGNEDRDDWANTTWVKTV